MKKTQISIALLGLTLATLPAVLSTSANAQTPTTSPKGEAKVDKRIAGIAGYYASNTPNAPTIEVKVSETGEIIMQVKGYPALTMTLGKKDQLTNALLPAGYEFTVKRDDKKTVIAIEGKTPQGTVLYKKSEKPVEKPAEKKVEPKAEPKKEVAEIPDILGKYEPAEAGPIGSVEIVQRDGKIITVAEGQPEFTVTVKGDAVTSPDFPDGITVTLKRDADKKVVGFTISMQGTDIVMNRKTFVPVPKAEPKKEEKAEVPDILGKYEPSEAGPIPGVEIKYKDGKILSIADGQPDFVLTVKGDTVLCKDFPDGVTVTLKRDADKKVIGFTIKANEGEIVMNRKTFVPVPKTEEKKTEEKKVEDKALARLKATEGTYTSEIPGVPVVTVKVKDGKLILQAEGNPEVEVELTDKDVLKSDKLPEGFVLKLVRDKNGVVTGMTADTPMGQATFTRKPA
jgi:dihydrofolate reductase